MNKKIFAILLSVVLIAAMLVGCGGSSSTPEESDATEKSTEASASSEGSREKLRTGVLSALNITEDEYKEINDIRVKVMSILRVKDVPSIDIKREVVFFDNLDSMQMALEAGDIDWMQIPDSTANYLIAQNDKIQTSIRSDRHKDLNEEEMRFLDSISNTGFAFMMRENSEKIRDDFNDALDDMKKDGTLDMLIKEHITDVVDGKEPKAVEFDGNGDETIKVAVTGDLPPMDYMTSDGSFAGFNTAILAEIGKRLNKKIELKQVDSAARAISLSSNEVDVVFWTRVGSGTSFEDDLESNEKSQDQNISEEDEGKLEKTKEAEETLRESGYLDQVNKMDVPEGTIVTEPYYTDWLILVGLKK